MYENSEDIAMSSKSDNFYSNSGQKVQNKEERGYKVINKEIKMFFECRTRKYLILTLFHNLHLLSLMGNLSKISRKGGRTGIVLAILKVYNGLKSPCCDVLS